MRKISRVDSRFVLILSKIAPYTELCKQLFYKKMKKKIEIMLIFSVYDVMYMRLNPEI